jgi:hypothetical protein
LHLLLQLLDLLLELLQLLLHLLLVRWSTCSFPNLHVWLPSLVPALQSRRSLQARGVLLPERLLLITLVLLILLLSFRSCRFLNPATSLNLCLHTLCLLEALPHFWQLLPGKLLNLCILMLIGDLFQVLQVLTSLLGYVAEESLIKLLAACPNHVLELLQVKLQPMLLGNLLKLLISPHFSPIELDKEFSRISKAGEVWKNNRSA